MADLLALVCDVYCDFVFFSVGILLIVSTPGPWCISCFNGVSFFMSKISMKGRCFSLFFLL